MYVLLGTNPAESKRNLIRLLDDIVLSRTTEDPRVEDIGINKVPGKYSGLRQHELLSIQNALSSVDQWAFECQQQQITCGLFFVTTQGEEVALWKSAF